MKCNTAVFYDIKSLLTGFGSGAGLDLEELHNQVLALKEVNGVSVQRAYADWAESANRELRDLILQVGIEPVQIFALSPKDDAKNVANISMAIDAVDLISKNPEIDNYVIATGDSIFAFLVKKLREHGKHVIGCGFESDSNEIFQKAVNKFISLGKSKPAAPVAPATRKPKSPTAKKAQTESVVNDAAEDEIKETKSVVTQPAIKQEEPSAKGRKRRRLSEKKPVRFPDNEHSNLLFDSDIEVIRDGALTPLYKCLHSVRDIVKALFSKPVKNSVGVSIKDFIVYMKHYLRGFKVTDYEFKRIESFMRFMLTGSPYCLYTIGDKSYIAPRRKVKTDTIADDVHALSITTLDGKRYTSVFDVPRSESFVYTYSDTKKPRGIRGRKAAGTTDGRVGRKKIAVNHDIDLDVPLRGWAKDLFNKLSKDDALSLADVKKLKDAAYSKEIFGINTPCFLEIETSKNLDEQRTVNGKLRYWKEIFRFNGRTYLIYKDWVNNLHKDRFLNWYAALTK